MTVYRGATLRDDFASLATAETSRGNCRTGEEHGGVASSWPVAVQTAEEGRSRTSVWRTVPGRGDRKRRGSRSTADTYTPGRGGSRTRDPLLSRSTIAGRDSAPHANRLFFTLRNNRSDTPRSLCMFTESPRVVQITILDLARHF